MKWLALLKSFPKFVLVVGVIVGSTALFCIWRFTHKTKKAAAEQSPAPIVVEDFSAKFALIEAKFDHLLLIDNDLYDIDDGALVFKNWLKDNGVPLQLFYDAETKKFFARYERGFARYALDGNQEATLGQNRPPLFTADLKSILFVKDKDIWWADVNWPAMKFENERRITSIEQFHEQNFASNVILRTEKTLLVRNGNQFLRVNLETGDVKPMRVKLDYIGKRRSPDSKWVIGVDQNQFHCYDVDADELKTLPVGRAVLTDCQWLGNDKCAILLSGKTVLLYDRQKHAITETTTLAAVCNKIEIPSPDGRFLFCVGNHAGFLLDLEKKTAAPVIAGGGVTWVSNDTFAFARETTDSSQRGTWLQTVNEPERRVSSEPYLFDRGGGKIALAKAVDSVIFVTRHGVSKMKPGGIDAVEVIKLARAARRMLGVGEWNR